MVNFNGIITNILEYVLFINFNPLYPWIDYFKYSDHDLLNLSNTWRIKSL